MSSLVTTSLWRQWCVCCKPHHQQHARYETLLSTNSCHVTEVNPEPHLDLLLRRQCCIDGLPHQRQQACYIAVLLQKAAFDALSLTLTCCSGGSAA
jgi:hypothetical protein